MGAAKCSRLCLVSVSRLGLAVTEAIGLYALRRASDGLIPLRLSFLFKKVVVSGHCRLTLSLTVNEPLKWLASLPILMQESFRW